MCNPKKFFKGFVLLALFENTFAQTPDSLSNTLLELNVEEIMKLPVKVQTDIEVVSAAKVRQRLEDAPNIIDVAFKSQIHKYGWIGTQEVLNAQPGFFFCQDYDRRTIGFRGMFEGWNNNHLLMLIDGIPFNDNLYGTAYTSEITPLVFVKNMEIIRGAGGALYGTNAMNGVVSLNTPLKEEIGKTGELRLRWGNHGYRIYDLLAGAETKKMGVVTAFHYFNTDGVQYNSYDRSARTDANGNRLKFPVNDQRSNTYFFAKIYGKEKWEGLSLQYHLQSWEFGTGHGWLFMIPDQPEKMKEQRNILAVRYAPRKEFHKFNYELTTRLQNHSIDWFMRYYPSNTVEGYPEGLTEYLQTDATDFFGRAQIDYQHSLGTLLAGTEYMLFYYNGDKQHYSNVYLGGDYLPFPNNEWQKVGDWLEFVTNKPVNSLGTFAQYISPKLWQQLQVTVSGRYDVQWFDYRQIFEEGKPLRSKNFSQLTPRASLIWNASPSLSFKLIAGRAFRYPTPTEMFGANTFTLASNIEELKAETVTNYDIALNWKKNDWLNVALNAFWIDFRNQIAYSEANANLSTNVYSLKTAGVEFSTKVNRKKWSGFFNYTYSRRLNEQIQDTLITAYPDRVAWAPAHRANMGINYNHQKFYFTVQAQYQGKVYRRKSDKFFRGEPIPSLYRPTDYINGWINTHIKFAYYLSSRLETGIMLSNLLNQTQYLLKTNYDWTDYQREGRRILLDVLYKF